MGFFNFAEARGGLPEMESPGSIDFYFKTEKIS